VGENIKNNDLSEFIFKVFFDKKNENYRKNHGME